MNGVIRRWPWEERHTGRRPCDDEAKIGVMHRQVQEPQQLPANYQKLGRGKEEFSSRYQMEHGLADNFFRPSAFKTE